jgi:pyridoxal phosphate enzyme (YggS family)
MGSIAANLAHVRERINIAAERCGRDAAGIRLLAVGKTHPAAALRSAYTAGQREFGENYVQEAEAKVAALADTDIVWHFIGALQSNKTRGVAERCAWVHTIDRLKIARRLAAQRPPNLEPLNVCIEVRLSDEPGKAGVAPADLPELAAAVAGLDRLRLRGLMTLPASAEGFSAQRAPFARLRQLLEMLNNLGFDLDALSMGMSADLEAAIFEGATIVRVGTAIFGPRPRR